MIVNTELLMPMPRPSAMTAANVKRRSFANMRALNLTSCAMSWSHGHTHTSRDRSRASRSLPSARCVPATRSRSLTPLARNSSAFI